MRLARFGLRTLLSVFVLVGVGLVLWQNVIQPRAFSPKLGGYIYYGNGSPERPHTAMVIYGERRPRIAVLDFYLDKAWQSRPGGGRYIAAAVGVGEGTSQVEIDGTRVYAYAGGLRLFIRRKDGSWEDRFIPDKEMEKFTNAGGFLVRPAEFWEQWKK